MLELSNNIVDKENGGFGSKHAHWNIVQSQCSCAILSNFDILSLAVNGLYLLVFG
jgi:hypothetical protein